MRMYALYCIVLYCIVLYCIVLYCVVLYLLYCIVLHSIVLCCTVLHCAVLYCTALFSTVLWNKTEIEMKCCDDRWLKYEWVLSYFRCVVDEYCIAEGDRNGKLKMTVLYLLCHRVLQYSAVEYSAVCYNTVQCISLPHLSSILPLSSDDFPLFALSHLSTICPLTLPPIILLSHW